MKLDDDHGAAMLPHLPSRTPGFVRKPATTLRHLQDHSNGGCGAVPRSRQVVKQWAIRFG
jgi:hypothetical protein